MKKILRLLTNKLFVIGLVLVAEFGLVLFIAYNLSLNFAAIHFILLALSFVLLIYIINRNDNPHYRLAWAIVILTVPPFGAVLYLIFGGKKVPKKLRERLSDTYDEDIYLQDNQITKRLEREKFDWIRLVRYISYSSHFPIYENTRSEYLDSGEKKFQRMKEEMRKAESFIFLEYFIIKEGLMWQEVLEILTEKVKEGVDVRLLYDDWGASLFQDLKQQCLDAGIKVFAFNPLVPRLAIQMNNRDHRKILVVDGRVGFVGGMNIADEYINIGSKYGHWKDTAVMIEGDAVHSLTLMFLQFYSYYSNTVEDPNDFKYTFEDLVPDDGYVMPFADAPTDGFDVGADAHLSMISNAKKYVYIQTPYLIVGYDMLEALVLAAQSGVDVRIIVPGIPDKKIVNQVTKSNYEHLIKGGVKIYEYSPGFVHSKTLVADDEACLVGTTNMDFRSYYLHFECSILFLGGPVVEDAYQDIMDTLEVSHQVTQKELDETHFVITIIRSIAKIFSGLM
ncbi:cardiolipin synthase [Erysipelothrix urinaevulpis]|uniref:cardiolipin synthase n=1 Tax=Erysipelothrix urinaevulpis TaxID=2683717 RepID=UPI001356ECBF|nr:cardiolipin synthase [Erysipelothrix urinaevulpis]